MSNAGDPRGPAASAADAERLMGEVAAAVARKAERAHIHMLAAEALMFGANPGRVHAAAGLNDLEQRLVARLSQEFAADDAAVEEETRKRLGSSQAARK
ncbi:fructose-1,6-bisphosphatase/sedoheptulose 1,7-bisphosphatase-like protein [Nocardia sp. GAS34]|uniref:hypothetical protein n=1 Tax=unclassified Nocardia TaxID=2637762 RepID=UPI003D2576E1